MTGSIWRDFWWTNITGPKSFVEKASTALMQNKMLILQVPSDIPWRYAMRKYIQDDFKERIGARGIFFSEYDMHDDNLDCLEPADFIFEKYKNELSGYRAKSKISLQEYIAQKNILKNEIIWIKGLEPETAEKWIHFCEGFTPEFSLEHLFALEIQGKALNQKSPVFDYVDYNESVCSYDLQLFNSFILNSEDQYDGPWKDYISTLATILCDTDAQISEKFLHSVDFKTDYPSEGIISIAQASEFSHRGAEEGSNHILSIVRNNNFEEVNRRIWMAQVKVLLPIIEIERANMIDKYEDLIWEALQNHYITQHGEQVTNPKDLEIGKLYSMINSHYDTKKKRWEDKILNIPDDNDVNRIGFLRDRRNDLSHLTVCMPEQVRQLIEGA